MGLSLGLASCAKQSESELEERTQERVLFTLNLTGLSATLEGNSDELRSLVLEPNKDNRLIPTPKFQDGERVPVHTAIRNAKGDAYAVKTLEWIYDEKSKSLTLDRYDGHGFTVVGTQSGNYTRGETWYIAGVIGGKLIDGEVVFEDSKRSMSASEWKEGLEFSKDKNFEIPLAFDWIPVTINADLTIGTGSKVARFRPMGSILHVQLGNAMTEGVLQPNEFIITSNAFATGGKFQLKPTGQATDVVTEQSDKLLFTPVEDCSRPYDLTAYGYTFPAGAVNQADHYLWVMPTAVGRSGAGIWTQIILRGEREQSFKDYTNNFYTTATQQARPMQDGVIYHVKTNALESVRLPIEYVADYNLAGGRRDEGAGYQSSPIGIGVGGDLRFQNRRSDGSLIPSYYQDYVASGTPSSNVYNYRILLGEVDATINPQGKHINELTVWDTDDSKIPLGSKYHVPSHDEWWGTWISFGAGGNISPNYSGGFDWTPTANSPSGAVNEHIAVGQAYSPTQGLRRYYTSEFSKPVAGSSASNRGTIYAIRFDKPTPATGKLCVEPQVLDGNFLNESRIYYPAPDRSMRCAYRYRLMGNRLTSSLVDSRNMLQVSVVYLGDNQTTLADVQSEAWWSAQEAQRRVHTRHYTADGYYQRGTVFKSWATYHAAELRNEASTNRVRFNQNFFQGYNSYTISGNHYQSIRLHYNNEVATQMAQTNGLDYTK